MLTLICVNSKRLYYYLLLYDAWTQILPSPLLPVIKISTTTVTLWLTSSLYLLSPCPLSFINHLLLPSPFHRYFLLSYLHFLSISQSRLPSFPTSLLLFIPLLLLLLSVSYFFPFSPSVLLCLSPFLLSSFSNSFPSLSSSLSLHSALPFTFLPSLVYSLDSSSFFPLPFPSVPL